jgi:hypothetical protein
VDGHWIIEPEQTAYHQQLQIHEALDVQVDRVEKLVSSTEFPLFEGKTGLLSISPTYGLVLHVTRANDHPLQMGSSGPMDAHIYPLVKGVTTSGREAAAPVVLIENTKGRFSGGRWVLINQTVDASFWSKDGEMALGECIAFCAKGVTELWLKPNYASYELGEQPQLAIHLQDLHTMGSTLPVEWTFTLVLRDPQGEPIWKNSLTLAGSRELTIRRLSVPVAMQPGLHIVDCEARSSLGEVRRWEQGLWGYDAALLQSGEHLTCDHDYFWKNGQPLPIVGMTYMTSDVGRKYLFMPNVAIWDRDMSAMKRAGINYIRTGLWTAFRHVMYVDGHPSEEVLRAIDAFFLTAKKHDLEVTFNFFSFTPETWEGVNPYLDPRSIEAQKRLIAAVVSRHRDSKHVHWDLINEPSMFDEKRLFSGPVSSHDRYEKAAYITWLKARHSSIDLLQQRWNMTPAELSAFESVVPPEANEINFNTTEISAKKGTRWLDYCLFTMEMHNQWARELVSTIRAIVPNQLVTVGQDEGLAGKRPSPFFYASEVDYTTVHSWWMMDQLVWDGIFAKAPDKPNLIQETGIMYVERADGKAKRSEEELRNILERKYAYAFSTGGAGAVQWIWNSNHYMDNVNESNIGALRSDGTEKPEADVSYDYGAFMQAAAPLFVERALEDIVAIYPYSNDFSNRPMAQEATARLTRTLSYELKLPFRALGEYHLEALGGAKLILVPSAHNFSDEALAQLIRHVEHHGGVLLLTGPVSLDPYWVKQDRCRRWFGETSVHNLLREELLLLDGKVLPASFSGPAIAQLVKEVPASQSVREPVALQQAAIGRGQLLWCPLPLELSDSNGTLGALYEHALAAASVQDDLIWRQGKALLGVYGRKLAFREGALYIFVSEFACDAEIEVTDRVSSRTYRFVLERERSVMFATDLAGELIAVYRPDEVNVEVQ